MKVEEPTLGSKGFLPFKFLNFSRSVEVQTTEPRKLKRKETKEKTNQKSPLHWTAPAVLISLGWMETFRGLNGELHLSLLKQSQNMVSKSVCNLQRSGLAAGYIVQFLSVSVLPSFFSLLGQGPRDFLYLWLWCLWDSNGRCKNPCIHLYPYEPALPESCPSIGSLICPLPIQVLFSFPLGPTPSLIPWKVFVWVQALWVLWNRSSLQAKKKKLLEIMELGLLTKIKSRVTKIKQDPGFVGPKV